jgi:hypothetical protein
MMKSSSADRGFSYLIAYSSGSWKLRKNRRYKAIAEYPDGYASQYSGSLSVYYFFNVIFIYGNPAGDSRLPEYLNRTRF